MSACRSATSARSSSPTGSRTTRCCSCPTSCRPAGRRRRIAQIEPGDTVAVWGCGPVGLFAVQSAFLMGAERVIAIDHFPHRLELAKKFGAETINFEESADLRGADGDDRRDRPRRLHRRGRAGGARLLRRQRARPDQEVDLPRHRSHPFDPPGDPRLPQGRPRLDAGGLWRLRRQVPARRVHGEGPDAQDRADPRPALHAGAAQRDPRRQDRYHLPDLATACRSSRRPKATRCSTTTRTK